jgi:uncharacterized protein with PIN domain
MGLFDIIKRRDVLLLKHKLNNIRQAIINDGLASDNIAKVPKYPLEPKILYDTTAHSDILTITFQAIRDEIFRNGFEFRPRFVKKCENDECEAEFNEEVERCEICNSTVRDPSKDNVEDLEKQIKTGVNLNGQALFEVLKEFEEDLEVIDNGYLMFIKEYLFKGTEIFQSNISEILRGNPIFISKIANDEGVPSMDNEGNIQKICVDHRDILRDDKEFCPVCGKRLYPALFVSEKKSKKVYYIEGEILHVSKYNPSILYGYSNIFSCWMKVITLWQMDKYIMQYYQKQRSPKGLLVANTSNRDSLEAAWEAIKIKASQNPHLAQLLAIEHNSASKDMVKWIDFMKPLSEMQYTETRNEMRRQVGACFGVMPIFHADISTSGGLNNEGMQITVTNRAVERGQMIFNDKVFPFMLKQFGIFDYELVLMPNEEQDEAADQELMNKKILNARAMLEMGFEVQFKDDDFTYSGDPDPDAVLPKEPMGLPGFPANNVADDVQSVTGEPKKSFKPSPYKALKTMWEIEQEDIEKNIDRNIVMKADNEHLDKLTEQMYDLKFVGLTKKQSEGLKDIMLDGFIERKGIREVSREAEKYLDGAISAGEVERIIRTEHTAIRNKMREFMFQEADPENKLKYKWVGPTDHRTTDICESIKRRTKKGVSLKQLKKIVNEESRKGGFEPRDWVPHINCRHLFTALRS